MAEKKAKFRRATQTQKDAYSGLYPLHGYIFYQGFQLPVEILNQPDNKYEIIAPDGYHFDDGIVTSNCDCSLHTLLCVDAEDRNRVLSMTLSKCGGPASEEEPPRV